MNTRARKTVIDCITAEIIVDVIRSHKSLKRKRQCQISFAFHFHCFEVYASFSAISFIVKHVTTMIKVSSFYTMIWAVYYDDEKIMNRIMISSSLNYYKINAFFIQKIIEKVKKRDILMHSRFVIVGFNSFKNFILTVFEEFKNWNKMNELIK